MKTLIPSRRWAAVLLFILAPLLLGASECNFLSDETIKSPTEPTACLPPDSLPAFVVPDPDGCVATASGNQCSAEFGIQPPAPKVLSWSFPSAEVSNSSAASGTVTWADVQNLPFRTDWSLLACTCNAVDDPDRDSCAQTSGSVTFRSSA